MKQMLVILLLGIAPAALANGVKAHAPKAVDYPKDVAKPFGIAADPRKAKRTIRVEMSDAMRYSPAEIRVEAGEAVRFVPVNKGRVLHEMVLGTLEALKKHAALMKKFPGMEHDEPHMAHVAPGKSGEIGWRFTQPGTYYFGCLIPGHFEAGMIGKVTVK
jgi:uncharacterized cupredoxin-like copper-binding protein